MRQKIQTALALYREHIPYRHTYYKLFRKTIMRNINKNVSNALNGDGLLPTIQGILPINVNNLRMVSPQEKGDIIKAADKVMRNTFNYLGSGDVVMNPVRWDEDFISGFKWPKGTYYKRYKQVDLNAHADVKAPRELSRSHFLLHLALAYNFTGDKKYAQKTIELILDWIDNNPFLKSINWCCSMDVAIRAVNWIWAIAMLKGFEIEQSKSGLISQSLYQHGWYIIRNLEGNVLHYNGNHYYSDLVGLLHLGLLFKQDKEGAFWLAYAKRELFREMRLQILPSGMHYEGSTNYHRLVLELTIPCLTLLKWNGIVVPPDIDSRLESMFDFVEHFLMPNGEMPIIGDQDNGRCLPLGVEDTNDYRYLLRLRDCLYSTLNNSGDDFNVYSAVFCNEDKTKYLEPSIIVNQGLSYYKDAGFALLKNKDWYLLINTDNQGMYRDDTISTGHTHADWLSFVLCYKGVPFLIDPGTYVYSSNPDKRNLFRSTMMHNSIVIDDRSQARIPDTELWSLYRKGKTSTQVSSNESIERIIIKHDAYSSAQEQVNHERCFSYEKRDNCILLEDEITSAKSHDVRVYYHLAEGVSYTQKNGSFVLEKEGKQLLMELSSSHDYTIEIIDGDVSLAYGAIVHSKIICISAVGSDRYSVRTIYKVF